MGDETLNLLKRLVKLDKLGAITIYNLEHFCEMEDILNTAKKLIENPSYIVCNDHIFKGSPRIAGTRISVHRIEVLSKDSSVGDIASILGLTTEEVELAIDYATEHQVEVSRGEL